MTKKKRKRLLTTNIDSILQIKSTANLEKKTSQS